MTALFSGRLEGVSRSIPLVGDSSLVTPAARYRAVQDAAKAMLDPLLPLMIPGKAEVAINDPRPTVSGPIGNDLCTRFEACVRPLLLAAHWFHSLQHERRPEHETTRQQVATWFRRALVLGTDPTGPEYWGADANYYQLHVDMGLLPLAFQMARAELWDPFTIAEKTQIAAWLGTSRGAAYIHANHYFMGVHVLEFLGQEGFAHRMDRPLIDNFFRRMEAWHHGGGWFEDGANQSFDYYNAYAFHYYGQWWSQLYGRLDPARAERWRQWTKLFLRDYEHFFSASGEHAPFGRSLPYRFNAIAIFGLAVQNDACDLPLGRVRRLCTRNLDFFLQRPIFQEQGGLSYGWTDRFDPIAESYSHPGSPYWAAKGFSLLLLPVTHAFWSEAPEPLQSEGRDYARAMSPAGLVVRSVGGAVEILNAGGQIAESRAFMGVWKWSKTAYRTGVGYTVPAGGDLAWSIDSALTQTVADGRRFGRHATYALAMDQNHLHYAWNMGDRDGPVSTGVESVIFWRGGWLLQVHHCDRHQRAALMLAGYALPSTQRDDIAFEPALNLDPLSAFSGDGRGTALQALRGFDHAGWDRRIDDHAPRTHLVADYHVTPFVQTRCDEGPVTLAALTWAGFDRAEAAPWTLARSDPGRWLFQHPHLGEWIVTHPALP